MTALGRLVVILGPTASGKSALAIHLAQEFSGEIVSCDSTQLYRHFDIGTAKLQAQDQQGIAHHLVDVVEPEEVFTAGDYRRRAERILGEISSRSKLPILTAGTGLYLRAVLEGLAEAPGRSEGLRARLRERAAERGAGYLHKILDRLDRKSARAIAARDVQKTIRAIEVCLLAGEPLSQLHGRARRGLEGYAVLKIGLAPPRRDLYARIDLRVQEMLAAGWLAEVNSLRERGVSTSAKPWGFLGYTELSAVLSGRLSMDQAIAQIQQATRRYAKRQLTWFRRETNVDWFEGFGDAPEVLRAARGRLVERFDRSHTVPY